ncbi:MAG: 4Fe-4S binding protein [Deltaproteobacteria bacterium]|nr:4Fe-4S binding protein [Deltaproteobacteria bacterium]
MEDLYKKLQIRLDEMATGYPATPTGVEIKLLKQLFTPEHAELFLDMSTTAETPQEVSKRTGRDMDETAQMLEDMALKGLLFRLREEGVPRYFAIPFIVGIYEFQINNLDKSMLKNISEYYLTGLGGSFHSLKTPHLRTIPINTEMVSKWPVASYDDAASIIARKDRIAIAPCLCRMAVRMYGKGCDHSLETCMQFDSFADYYVENSMGRYISKEEALAILERNIKEGLVIQPANSKEVEAMCACCSCCCGMLISLKLFPSPAREVKSNYFCVIDESSCTGCGTCIKRCPVDAVELNDEKARMIQDRCIGCGLCVSTCPTSSRSLVRKPEDEIYSPPETFFDTFGVMTEEKGESKG